MARFGWLFGWAPRIGDHSLVGWLTVIAYALSAWACWCARRAALCEAPATSRHGTWVLWTVLFWGLVALGVNKQLDLQTALTEFGRRVAHAQGWIEHRQTVQFGFVAAVGVIAIAVCAWLAWLARMELRRVLVALTGWCALGLFVAVRACSIHDVDRFLARSLAGTTMNAVLELGGITLVGAGAWVYRRPPS